MATKYDGFFFLGESFFSSLKDYELFVAHLYRYFASAARAKLLDKALSLVLRQVQGEISGV